jgi:prepilin-type N-terminal cleavage/methylation domain-containing protein
MRSPNAKFANRGFTLLEVVVVMAILSTLLALGSDLFRNIIRLDGELRGMLEVQEDARRAFKTVTKDLRIIAIADNGAYPIAEATDTSLTIYADADDDGKAERIRYYLTGNSLMRGKIIPVGNPPVYVTGDEESVELVTDLNLASVTLFEYHDSSYTGTESPLSSPIDIPSVRLIKVSLVIDKNLARAPADYLYTTQVSPRNLKDF